MFSSHSPNGGWSVFLCWWAGNFLPRQSLHFLPKSIVTWTLLFKFFPLPQAEERVCWTNREAFSSQTSYYFPIVSQLSAATFFSWNSWHQPSTLKSIGLRRPVGSIPFCLLTLPTGTTVLHDTIPSWSQKRLGCKTSQTTGPSHSLPSGEPDISWGWEELLLLRSQATTLLLPFWIDGREHTLGLTYRLGISFSHCGGKKASWPSQICGV